MGVRCAIVRITSRFIIITMAARLVVAYHHRITTIPKIDA